MPAGAGRPWGAVGALVGTGLALLGLWAWFSPEYLTVRGFPVDDAWIHAVYARAFASGAGLSYNPGVPATGETSPLWAVVLAPAHLLSADVATRVLLVKLTGFVLHLLSCVAAFLALRRASVAWALGGALAVLVHPDLVAASVSGMEVPLATLAAWGLVLCLGARSPLAFGLVSVAAPLCRPELPVLAFTLPVLLLVRDRRSWRAPVPYLVAAAAGTFASFGLLSLWNLAASGRPLTATFYAKVGSGGPSLWMAQALGFGELLPGLTFTVLPVLVVLAVLAIVELMRAEVSAPSRLAAAAAVSGLLFCAVSFKLIPPIDPSVFYHQRYALPALPLLIAPFLVLGGGWLQTRVPSLGRPAVAALALLPALACALGLPPRLERLTNDAHNIDDTQVALGRALASAPPEAVVWVTDAGAVRYFGQAFVVDTLGLNTPGMLGPDAQGYLDAHPPTYLEVVPLWSGLRSDASRPWPPPRVFQPSTPYTVTRFAAMQRHALFSCAEGTGLYEIRGRTFRFRCASSAPLVEGGP
ncbi:hypothetical protein [Corallococcus exiguus]|uniref:hypothetical protein n=1 Tax=Corallococcus exiguus TaxID=83462 RepID=UPI0015608968|nr:hypothetical protein [Corallococcus exiguus]NRD57528.1 hypothetical protein [Corallococcus exiguus]